MTKIIRVSGLATPAEPSVRPQDRPSATDLTEVVKLLQNAHGAMDNVQAEGDSDFESEDDEIVGAPTQYAGRKVMRALELLATLSSSATEPDRNAARYLLLRDEADRDYVEFAERWFESGDDLDAAVDAFLAARTQEQT